VKDKVPAKLTMIEFARRAKAEGYTIKVIGDYAYRKPRHKNGKYQYIKLWATNRITYSEQ